jgi:hypothetical protein
MNDPFFIGLDRKDPAKVVLGAAFKSYTVQLRDASVQYVSGGSGPAIIFLHGFSQDWYEFSHMFLPISSKTKLRGKNDGRKIRLSGLFDSMGTAVKEEHPPWVRSLGCSVKPGFFDGQGTHEGNYRRKAVHFQTTSSPRKPISTAE